MDSASYLIYVSQASMDILCKFTQQTDRTLVLNMEAEKESQQTLTARDVLCGGRKVKQGVSRCKTPFTIQEHHTSIEGKPQIQYGVKSTLPETQ